MSAVSHACRLGIFADSGLYADWEEGEQFMFWTWFMLSMVKAVKCGWSSLVTKTEEDLTTIELLHQSSHEQRCCCWSAVGF